MKGWGLRNLDFTPDIIRIIKPRRWGRQGMQHIWERRDIHLDF
jgi:hypothetical protein